MFSLIAGLFRLLFAKEELQILMVGLDYAGKTTLLEQMKGIFLKTEAIHPSKIPPTVGLNLARIDVEGCRVTFWDLGGQRRLRSIWDKYYSEAHALLFVIDSADPQRFVEAREALESVREHPDMTEVPVLVFANKQDLPTAVAIQEISSEFDLPASSRSVKIQLGSALTCEGIEDGIPWLVSAAKEVARRRSY